VHLVVPGNQVAPGVIARLIGQSCDDGVAVIVTNGDGRVDNGRAAAIRDYAYDVAVHWAGSLGDTEQTQRMQMNN
jgi:hypothetical protein